MNTQKSHSENGEKHGILELCVEKQNVANLFMPVNLHFIQLFYTLACKDGSDIQGKT